MSRELSQNSCSCDSCQSCISVTNLQTSCWVAEIFYTAERNTCWEKTLQFYKGSITEAGAWTEEKSNLVSFRKWHGDRKAGSRSTAKSLQDAPSIMEAGSWTVQVRVKRERGLNWERKEGVIKALGYGVAESHCWLSLYGGNGFIAAGSWFRQRWIPSYIQRMMSYFRRILRFLSSIS